VLQIAIQKLEQQISELTTIVKQQDDIENQSHPNDSESNESNDSNDNDHDHDIDFDGPIDSNILELLKQNSSSPQLLELLLEEQKQTTISKAINKRKRQK
jgi:hypothetical protein